MKHTTRLWFLILPILVLAVGCATRPAIADHTDSPSTVTIAGSLQDELGCSGDWQPECVNTQLTYDGDDDVWQAVFSVPAGDWEYKAALNSSWDENYGANAQFNGANIPLSLTGPADVKFYYDHKSHWITDNQNSRIATAPGNYQAALGCPGDWQPDCLRSWLQDLDGDGIYAFSTSAIPAGDYEAKVAIDENWDESYGQNGGADNIPFVVATGDKVTFAFDSATNLPSVTVTSAPADDLAAIAQPPVTDPFQDEVMYFVMPDRFFNGQIDNDTGGIAGDRLDHGFDVTDKGFYHGGDLAGLLAKMDYLESLGVTSIWMTPMFKNNPVQGSGADVSAAYHGYWITDFTQFDPHFGSNAELEAVIVEAHNRDMKVFFDIITNHTADILDYQEGQYSYRSKTDYPYKDASGVEFDDRDFVNDPNFPVMDAETSFPYTPVFNQAGDENVKVPAWLNDPTLYHNRGNSQFAGENSLYGDFFGLDDLFTERLDVVDGMVDIYKGWISDYAIDGFRIDTVKHVNIEFWEEFAGAILDHADSLGKDEFYIFGEVFSGNEQLLSYYTTRTELPAVLDFRFQENVRQYISNNGSASDLGDFFRDDDYFTDADSNAYILPTFLGNHDMGRFGYFLNADNGDSLSDADLLARTKLAHALMYFGRGVPVVYYGDEQGFTGTGGDKDARQDMFPSAVGEYNDPAINKQIGVDGTPADDNFDPTHPIYAALSDHATLFSQHKAVRSGAQVERFAANGPGIYAFSRMDRDEKIEYVVAINNSTAEQTEPVAVYAANAGFTRIAGVGGAATMASDANGQLSVTVPATDFVIYRADSPLQAAGAAAPGIAMTTPAGGAEVALGYQMLDGNSVPGRLEIAASLDRENVPAEVTFAVKINGQGDWLPIGTDTNPPYRVFYDASDLPAGTTLDIIAVVNDLNGNYAADQVAGVLPIYDETGPGPGSEDSYAVIHYLRTDGDYGDHTTGDFNDYWGLHLWGDAIEPSEVTDWPAPKPFLGEDSYGRFAWIALQDSNKDVNFIVHRGDNKDGTQADRSFNPGGDGPEIWVRQDDGEFYTSQAAAQGFVAIHYQRPDGQYDGWGLHLWGDAIADGVATEWANPRPYDGVDEFGVYWNVPIKNANAPVNFIIHRGDEKDPGPDQSIVPAEQAHAYIVSGDEIIYAQQGDAENFVLIHYRRDAADYGDPTSGDYNDFWGLHTWNAADDPGWTTPHKPVDQDIFGITFKVPLNDKSVEMGYILHRGDTKDPGPDQFLDFGKWGFEVWQPEGTDLEKPYILPILGETGGNPGNIDEQRAYWVDERTIAWDVADDPALTYTLHYAPDGGLTATDTGITGGSSIALTPGSLSDEVKAKFPHLADLPALVIADENLALVPDLLKGQIAVSAVDGGGLSVDATGLQIPGVLDDLYTYQGDLGVSWNGDTPTIRLWAPTAKSVKLHLFDTSTSEPASQVLDMTPGEQGTWSVDGDGSWKDKFYLFEVEVYVHSTGQVEQNRVTDPYSFGLAMNSTRSQFVDLADPALQPSGWENLSKPALAAPEDISIYEIHVRDFSANDSSVPEALKGTYKAFTLDDTHGVNHLKALQEAGLTHLHLLPVFDIATINENRGEWQAPDPAVLATYPPDSDQQQAEVTRYEDLDGFNWGYDPFHYTTPEGSYSTNPDGSARIVEFREMVQALNEQGLRVVMDVVYNHTNAAGQDEKSVLDRIVPGYFHRLDDMGQVETSTCCQNTASEHNMMEKLMVDSLVTWATEYKIDAFRFDLMGHHMVSNMVNARAALDALSLASDGVDGESIYIYGEGWNFGEVADNARGVNATQLNLGGEGIGTFSDRLRDAVRGGGPFDGGDDLVRRQGFANGLFFDPNALNSGSQEERNTLLLNADQIRVGMAGNLAGYKFIDRNGDLVTGAEVDYNGQPAGYTQDPQEDITYISKHDNQTLYDNNTYKIPDSVDMADRVRIQNVGLATVLLGQGVPFLHAGSDLLRSKSLDRDSFNSGDWFNRLDFTYQENNFGVGLPVAGKNQDNWFIMQPLLADPALKPGAGDITQMADLFRELLEIRYSSELFRLETAEDILARVEFHNTGPEQAPGLIVMSLSDRVEPDLDRDHESIVVAINANDEAQSIAVATLSDRDLRLHPVQMNSVDSVVKGALFDSESGTVTVPARSAAVFVELAPPVERIGYLIVDVEALVDAGVLNPGNGNALISKLENVIKDLNKGNTTPACNKLEAFINQVDAFMNSGKLAVEQGQALIDEAASIIGEVCN